MRMKREPYTQLLDRFVTVAETGTILGAATQLNVSQPSLTKSIKRIEQIFDVALFERSKKGVTLTPAGKVLLDHSRLALDEIALARREIFDLSTKDLQNLRVTAGTVWGTRLLPSILSDLQESFPSLSIMLDINLTPVGLSRLYKGDCDLVVGAVHDEEPLKPGFEMELLFPQRYALGCGANSPLVEMTAVSIQEAAKQPLVLYHEDQLLMTRVITELERQNRLTFKRTIVTDSVLAAMELVNTGRYIVFLAEATLKRFASAGLRIVDLDQKLYEFPTAMYFRESFRQTREFAHFAKRIRLLG